MSWNLQQNQERIAIYVDGANAYFAQKDVLGWWIDWANFLEHMREGKELVSARWYQSYRSHPDSDQDRFLHHVTLVGFAVRKKAQKIMRDRNSGEATVKGSLAVEMTIDALNEASHYDTAVIVTGDSDVTPLVEALRAKGKRVVIVATQQNISIDLRQIVGANFMDLHELRSRIESTKPMAAVRTEAPRNAAAAPAQLQHHDDVNDVDDDDDDDYDDDYDDDGYEDDDHQQPASSDYSYDYDEDQMRADPVDPADVDLPEEGATVRCSVQAVKRYGVFLDLHEHAKTLLHVKDMNRGFVPDAGEYYEVGEEIMVQIISIDRKVSPPEVRVTVSAPEVSI